MKTRGIGPLIALTWVIVATAAAAENAADSESKAALATALKGTHLSLASGFAAAQREGTPISGKYELEEGKLQLSVYTLKDGRFSEVIVDYATGAVARVVPIEDGQDARSAREQRGAMAKARRPLQEVANDALAANPGFTVVSVVPSLAEGRPFAEVTLVRGDEWKTLRDRLDADDDDD